MRPDDICSVRLRRVRIAALTALPALLIIAPTAQALQLLDVQDGVAIEAIVSLREPTRIRIEGTAITDVFGNIHSSGCNPPAAPTTSLVPITAAAQPVNPAGEFVLECDRDKGEIYIRPVGDGGKPINLFVSSSRATYTLVLRRSDTPADTIVLRDRTQRALSAEALEQRISGPAGASPTHVRALKALLVAMASGRPLPDVHVEAVGRPIQLWREAALTLLKRYENRNLVGEQYVLRNTGPGEMVLIEQEFDRPDGPEGGQVLAVAVEHHNLKPGESTRVFVIRRGGL